MSRIDRRSLLQLVGTAGLAGLGAKAGRLKPDTPVFASPRGHAASEQAVAQATRAMPSPNIKDVSVIATAPAGLRLTVVKIIDRSGRPLRLRLRAPSRSAPTW